MHPANDPLAPLRDSGQRYWRRFTPTADLPARVTLVAAGGRLTGREVFDLSLGGLGLRLKWRDPSRIAVGTSMHVELELMGGVPLRFRAKCMHMQKKKERLIAHWDAGLMFENNLAYAQAKSRIATYLLKLERRERERLAA